MKNIFISTYTDEWHSPAMILHERLGFVIVELKGKIYPSISSKRILMKKEINNTINIIRHLKVINDSNIIICSNYVMLFLLFLRKVRVLKCRELIWFGVYIHNPQMIKLVKYTISSFMPKNFGFRMVVFSKSEIGLYSSKLGLHSSSIIYVPYGDWGKTFINIEAKDKGYYFSGGYSNRDYVTLAKYFWGREEKLVIIASKQNFGFYDWVCKNTLPDNIQVFWDVTKEEFDEKLTNSHAIVLAMRYNTGASAQMVILSAMQNRKLVIATYTDCINEYIQNGKTGIVIDKLDDGFDISNCIDENQCNNVIEAAYEYYKQHFSYPAIAEQLVTSIREELMILGEKFT